MLPGGVQIAQAKTQQTLTVRQAETESALEASEIRQRELLAAVLEGIAVADEDGRIVYVNPSAMRLFGFDKEADMVGQPLGLLMPQAEAMQHNRYLTTHCVTGEARAIGVPGRALPGRRRDGSEFPIDLSVNSFHSGRNRFFAGVIRDVTDRRRAEAALR